MYVFVCISSVDVGLYEYEENMKATHQIIKADYVGRQGWVGGMGAEVKGESKKNK